MGIVSGGKADPYYKFFLDSDEIFGDQKDARNNKLEAKWAFILENKRLCTSQMIRIEIWDWDRVGKDELIGHFEMNTADFVKNQGIGEALLMGKTEKENLRLKHEFKDHSQTSKIWSSSNA